MDYEQIFSKFEPNKENILHILHELQNRNPNYYLTTDDLKQTARYLNTTLAHVYGVATYYSMFSLKPRGKNLIRICNSPVCNSLGSEKIIHGISEKLKISPGETTEDLKITFELCECLGRCGKAPSGMVNQKVITAINSDNLNNILEQLTKE